MQTPSQVLRTLYNFLFSKGFDGSTRLGGDPETFGSGSSNFVITGRGKNTVFKGLTSVSGSAARVMMNAGDDWFGIGSGSDSLGIGSVFKVLGAYFFIGSGTVYRNGTSISASASTTLQLKKVVSGALGTTYQAGLAQPSAPVIAAVTPPAGFVGKNNGTVSVQIVRIRSATGGVSNASPTSNVVAATNQSIAVTFPLADANGQDYWGVYATRNAFGADGVHLFLAEVTETEVAGTVTATATLDSDTTIGVPNGTLSSTNIGWQYTSAGDTTTYVTGVGANDSHSSGKQTITLAAASVITGTQSVTFTNAVSGATRTVVFEWRDADLAGGDAAPIRAYPPPSGIFGGVSGDVIFIDGALGDSVDVTRTAFESGTTASTTTSQVGNAIAVSDPARPESFPPDNYIFTGDAPTALLAGSGVHWRCAQNSVGVIRYVGGSPAVNYERIWNGIGVQKQHNIGLGMGGRPYFYTGQRGIVRLGVNGEPDAEFAIPVADETAGWTAANVVIGTDTNLGCVLYMHGRTILAYYEALGVWGANITVFPAATSNTIRSAVTVNGDVIIGSQLSTTITGYNFHRDDGNGYTGTAYTQWMPSAAVSDILARIHLAIRTDNITSPVSVSVYADGSDTARVTQVYTPDTTGKIHLPVLRPNVRNCKSWRIGVSIPSNGGDCGIDMMKVEGDSSDITF